MPGYTVMLFNGAIKLNLDSHDILKIINGLSEQGIVDYELYSKLLESKYRALLKNRIADTPYSRLAKFYFASQYGAKDAGGVACIIADVKGD